MKLRDKLFCFIRSKYFPTDQQIMVKKYLAEGGDIRFRYNYNLNENSIVFDVGGYEGQWASDIFARYKANIFVFEPVVSFYSSIKNRFKFNTKINVFNFGIGGETHEEIINFSADASSIFIKGDKGGEKIRILNFSDFLSGQKIINIDLIKINIEGGEYELLEEIIKSGNINKIDNLQIQFHDVFPEARDRMSKIQDYLSQTHKLTYQYLFVWENWKRIND